MNCGLKTLVAVEKLITGDRLQRTQKPIAPYRSGPELVTFFNSLGERDTYGEDFPSRWRYVRDKLKAWNGTQRLAATLHAALSPAHFIDTDFQLSEAAAYLNQLLELDGYRIVISHNKPIIESRSGLKVQQQSKLEARNSLSHEFIAEQGDKCDRKLAESDFDGAITNARSLVEAVLFELEARFDSKQQEYDGDLPRLFKRVQKLLHLEPERPDISENLRNILRGLASIIHGLAPLRNTMGDAHVRSHKPKRHHAKLAVNSAKTLADFLIDTYEYQRGKD